MFRRKNRWNRKHLWHSEYKSFRTRLLVFLFPSIRTKVVNKHFDDPAFLHGDCPHCKGSGKFPPRVRVRPIGR